MKNDEVWFVAADACDALDINNHRQAIAKLDADEKGVTQIDTPGGAQKINIITLAGLVRLIARSDKPEAKLFQRWIFHDVIPSIYKTGRYETNQQDPLEQIAESAGRQIPLPTQGTWTIIVEEDRSFRIHPEHFDAISAQFHLQDISVLAYAIKSIECVWERHTLENQSKGDEPTPTELKLAKIISHAVDLAANHIPYRQTINAG